MRPRCNTERKLEKLKNDRSKQSEVHTISWRESKPKNGDEEPTEDLFPKKERQNDNDKSQTKQYKLESLLSQQIATVPAPKENPFADYSRCDATSEKSENSTSIRVFLTGKYDYYRVFDMDLGHFKELLWLCFWCQTFFPIILMVEICVHFDICN